MAEQAAPVDCDVVVVGAGLAGLTVAYTILKHNGNLKVTVVEAGDHVGGQILTVEVRCANGETDQWDLGSIWVHKDQQELNSLLKELQIETYPQYEKGKKFMEMLDGKMKSYTSDLPIGMTANLDIYKYFSTAEKASAAVNLEDPPLTPNATELEKTSVETFCKKTLWTKGAADMVDVMVILNHFRAPAHISKLEYLHTMKSCGGYEAQLGGDGSESKIKGGASQICQRLVTHIGEGNIHTGEKVVTISREDPEKVLVKTECGKMMTAKHVVLTVPLHDMAKIEFTPALAVPFPKLSYSLGMISFVVTYSKFFWREAGCSGEVLSLPGVLSQIRELPKSSPLTMVTDGESTNGHPALIGTMAVGKLKDIEERRTYLLKKLSEFFGPQAEQAVDYADYEWAAEEGPKEMPTFTELNAFFSQPLERVHLAGAEISSSWVATMNGAVHSGIKAAKEVIQQMDLN